MIFRFLNMVSKTKNIFHEHLKSIFFISLSTKKTVKSEKDWKSFFKIPNRCKLNELGVFKKLNITTARSRNIKIRNWLNAVNDY